MSAPTGGPGGDFAGGANRTWFSRALVGSICAWLTYAPARDASAEPELRVTGSTSIDASASLEPGGCEVDVRLLDDAGRGVPYAAITVEPLGAVAPGLRVHECRSRAGELSANAAGAYSARSNDAGGLCLRFDGTKGTNEFEVAFHDASNLLAPSTRRIVADAALRSVELAFARAPTILALEHDTQVYSVSTRPHPAPSADEERERLDLSLRVVRDGEPERRVGGARVELGNAVEFRVPSAELGAPGSLEISVDFAGTATSRPASARLHATATALAVLSLAEPVGPTQVDASLTLPVRVSSVAGPVPGGLVEGQSNGRTLASAPVVDGRAEVSVPADDGAFKARSVELRYVPASPYWLAAGPLSVTVPVAPASQLRRVIFSLFALALIVFLLSSWQRPRRSRRSEASGAEVAAERARIEVIETFGVDEGWDGLLIDAHDRSPIADAHVTLRLPAFDASGVLRSARSDATGAFRLARVANVGPGAALEVRAPFHSPFSGPLPPPGKLVLCLVSRRRTLLARFAEWARREGRVPRREATPGEVARRSERQEVALWADAVDEAAFGPDPLSEAKETLITSREPPLGAKTP